MSSCNIKRGYRLRQSALAIGLALSLSGGAVFAQSSSGTIFGQTAAGQGTIVVLQNRDTGLTRQIPVDSSGRYRAAAMPVGRYKVLLQRDGKTISAQDNIVLQAGQGAEVSFAAEAGAKTLEGVSVSASSLPAIDMSSVDTRTVLTSEQLAAMPIPRDITQAALLAPGAVGSDSRYGNTASFGGAAASENQYYINGYPVTNPLTSLGSTTLPFNAIDEEQVLTGGYGAEYGRSTGGVINIVTKRGGNAWKAGLAVYWTPEGLRSDPRNIYYVPGTQAPRSGQLYQYRQRNKSTSTTTSAYISGPLIQDKLFIYATGDLQKQQGQTYQNIDTATRIGRTESSYTIPRWLTKLDWNITDSNLLEFTAISDKTEQDVTNFSPVAYPALTGGTRKTGGFRYKDGGEVYIAKYTGYLTDTLTLTAQYGQQDQVHYSAPLNYNPNAIFVSDLRSVGPTERKYSNPNQPYATPGTPKNKDSTNGWRLDLDWRLGDHTVTFGADRQDLQSTAVTTNSGPNGAAYIYRRTATPNDPIDAGRGVGAPLQQDYLDINVFTNGGTFKVQQSAQYVQDAWQVNDRWLLKAGLRNEQFTNFNADGVAYVRQRHQLAPRLGVSWDVFGDSSLKIFADAGRYYLSMPNNVALRAAAGSLFTDQYFVYSGVDANGLPINPVPIGRDGPGLGPLPGPVSANNEFGQAPDPRTVAAKGLKSHYQDEYILGAEKQLSAYVLGAKLTYRKLRSAIDDTCYQPLGGNCRLFNPGRSNTFLIDNGNGTFSELTVTQAQSGMPPLKRGYYGLDLFLEHPFKDNWYGKVAYTFSRNYGNTEGQLLSDVGQQDVSQTQAWDFPELMVGSNGPLPNDRTHALKAYGFYQFTPEWRFGSTFTAVSGRPKNCLGYWPDRTYQFSYGSSYFDCGTDATGYKPTPRGSQGRLPWTYTFDLSVAYIPAFADHKLVLQMDVFNLFNRQTTQNIIEQYYRPRNSLRADGGRPISYSDARSVRISARYDFSL